MSFYAPLHLLYRMQCTDILADRDSDGQWTIAKAVFSSPVTGTVTMVKTTTDTALSTDSKILYVVNGMI